MTPFQHAPDRPWIFRTYAGHSTAAKSNALYRSNLAKGQTGLSIAFDLPTQTALDPDHVLARGEVGKVGVPVSHLGDMRTLFEGIPLAGMNTSMTINAPAAWLIALYVSLADEQGAPRALLAGTTQNDILKEYLSRGTYVFPPGPSLKLTADTISWCLGEMPKWNPMNVCSYHLQEAGARPDQELAFALATAIAVLDTVRARGEVPPEQFPATFGRISFFVNAGIRFVTELCKMRAFGELWDEIGRNRYGVTDESALRFRYGVQVNSLGLTEPQAENNPYRILLEMLAVTLSKSARARAVQLPAWNEALGLPRPWDQQWSLRMQQILAFETDLLEYEDIFDGSHVVSAKVAELIEQARGVLAEIDMLGGAVAAVDWMKADLVNANRERVSAIERGHLTVVGVNRYTETEPSPLAAGESAIQTVDPAVEQQAIASLRAWRAARNPGHVREALAALEAAAREDRNIMDASVACARAGVTTGEWGACLREVYGQYRGPTGVAVSLEPETEADKDIALAVQRVSLRLGRQLTYLLGKPGLDGHSNGAEQIATRARSVGMAVIYDGIRSTPEEIVSRAVEARPHIIGLSILSGSHLELVREVMGGLRAAGLGHVPVLVGGIIPSEDEQLLRQFGVAAVYTPKDYRLGDIMRDMVALVDARVESLVGADRA